MKSSLTCQEKERYVKELERPPKITADTKNTADSKEHRSSSAQVCSPATGSLLSLQSITSNIEPIRRPPLHLPLQIVAWTRLIPDIIPRQRLIIQLALQLPLHRLFPQTLEIRTLVRVLKRGQKAGEVPDMLVRVHPGIGSTHELATENFDAVVQMRADHVFGVAEGPASVVCVCRGRAIVVDVQEGGFAEEVDAVQEMEDFDADEVAAAFGIGEAGMVG